MSFLLKPLAFISASAISLLGLVSTRSKKARYYFHLTLYFSTMGLCSVLGVVYSIALSLVGQRLNINYLTARSFYYLCYPLIGIKLEVEGREHLDGLMTLGENGKAQSAVLVGNHQSFLDILYLGRIFPKRAVIMAKKELRWAPLLGQYLTLSGAVMVDRKNSKDAVKMMHHVGEDMKRKGVSLWIFPEGTRSLRKEDEMLPFKKGAFHLAVQAAVPVVPVVCENYHRLFDGKRLFERGTLKIKILPPIPTQGLSSEDVGQLAQDVRESMMTTLKDLSAASRASSSSSSSLESDETALLPKDHKDKESVKSKGYGTGELRRRNSPASGAASVSDAPAGKGKADKQEVAETGSVDGPGGVMAGALDAVKGESATSSKAGQADEEESDDGAVLVGRPEDE